MCQKRSKVPFKSLDGEEMDVCDHSDGSFAGLSGVPLLVAPSESTMEAPKKRGRGRPKGTYATGSKRGLKHGGKAKMPKLDGKTDYLVEANKCSIPRWKQLDKGRWRNQCRCMCSDDGNASILKNSVCEKAGEMPASCSNHPDRKKRSGKKRG